MLLSIYEAFRAYARNLSHMIILSSTACNLRVWTVNTRRIRKRAGRNFGTTGNTCYS